MGKTMKTLIFGAGTLGSLYACLFHRAGKDVTILARNKQYDFIKENGVVLLNEFTGERIVEKVKVTDSLKETDSYDLVIVIMRRNSLKNVFSILSENKNIKNFLFMGNNASGFDEYIKFLPKEKLLFGFPGGGGSRLNHVIHYIDSEKPNGKRFPIILGEIDGEVKERTKRIQQLFESSRVPVKIVDDMDSWLKYYVAFVLPIAGALLKAGDNYKLARDAETIRIYIRAVNECTKVLKVLGYKKSFNPKLKFFNYFPETLLIKILKRVFNSRFAEVAMMMHVNAARDEMLELGNDFKILINQTSIETPGFNELFSYIFSK
jgi:2-dehydropantoate 2-reductase